MPNTFDDFLLISLSNELQANIFYKKNIRFSSDRAKTHCVPTVTAMNRLNIDSSLACQ